MLTSYGEKNLDQGKNDKDLQKVIDAGIRKGGSGPKDGQRGKPKGPRTDYLQIEPEQRVVYATSLTSADRLTFAGTVAITFEATNAGTRLRLIEQGLYFDGQDDVAGHRSGWEGMLEALGKYLRGRR